jgi:8-oxo-dGTP pyrophosphatase MutT (NUDIX family)
MGSTEVPAGTQPHIRPIAICVFRNSGRILVGEAYDAVRGECFHRPVGGGIHFGETSRAAMLRELDEELGRAVADLHLLGVLENLFVCEGEQGHEVVFVYDARFVDESLYKREHLDCEESCGTPFHAVWRDLDDRADEAPPLYPDGLAELLQALI